MLKIRKRRRAPSTGARRSPSRGSGQSTIAPSSMISSRLNIAQERTASTRPCRKPPRREATCRGRAAGIRNCGGFCESMRGAAAKVHTSAACHHDPWEHACCLLSGDFLCPTGDAFINSCRCQPQSIVFSLINLPGKVHFQIFTTRKSAMRPTGVDWSDLTKYVCR